MEFYEHPAYIGFAKKDERRNPIFEAQYNKDGFDDSCTWSLDYTIARFILPRLNRYSEIAEDVIEITPEFRKAISRMQLGFGILAADKVITKHDYIRVHIAFEELKNYHGSMWW